MANVEMYTTRICPWCVRAKRLLNSKGVPDDDITEINVDFDRSVMVERTGGNKSAAADALGISRSRLYRLLGEDG